MKEAKLSVVIPVYKVERTLDRCVESVLSQAIPQMEVILVDDGSPDNCPRQCDEWAAKDSRITVLHKENGGLSDARNAGLDAVTGQYVTFIDSDDYIGDDTLTSLLNILEQHPEYDILEYPINEYEGDSDKESLLVFDDQAYTDIHTYWYTTQAYKHTYACNKIYRQNLFANVRYPKGKVYEDALTYPRLMEEVHCVATTSQGLYHYCQNPEGITSQADGDAFRTLLNAHLSIISNPLFLPTTEDYCLQLLNIQIYTNELTGDAPRIPHLHFQRLRNTKTTLYNILGINTLCKLNRCFRKIVRRQ